MVPCALAAARPPAPAHCADARRPSRAASRRVRTAHGTARRNRESRSHGPNHPVIGWNHVRMFRFFSTVNTQSVSRKRLLTRGLAKLSFRLGNMCGFLATRRRGGVPAVCASRSRCRLPFRSVGFAVSTCTCRALAEHPATLRVAQVTSAWRRLAPSRVQQQPASTPSI
jgi:hypothetical protein